ncbi:MAG TPA: choice-of-anchor Q domain-containing protein, partial [Anaerolineales bacterium]|nr:choice-of-anchor Q domain-containing protein [Anaerolineales bacterium]
NTTAILADGMPVLDYNGFWLNGADFNVPTGTLTGTHNVFANPLFVAPSAGDYHLSPGSQMIDAGTSMGAPTTDYDGDPRPVGIALDIGADEYSLRLLLPLVLR